MIHKKKQTPAEKMGAKSHQSFVGLWYIDPPVYLENFEKFLGPHYFQTIYLIEFMSGMMILF